MYALVKKNKKYQSDELVGFIGLDIVIKKNKLCIIKSELKDKIIKDKYLISFEKLVKSILIFLDTDTDSDGAAFLLDELAREYAVFKNKYLKELSVKTRDEYVRKVRLLANELKKYVKKKEIKEVKTRSR